MFFLILLLGISCSFFIILFQPFGIQNNNDQWYYNLFIIIMGLVFTLSYLFIDWLIPSIFSKLFRPWTFGKALLWYPFVVLFVGAALFLYKSYLGGYRDFTLQEYFFVIGRTFFIAITVSFFSLGLFQSFNRTRISLLSRNEEYLLQPQSGKPLRINPKNILYISSNDNYVEIHYLSSESRKKELFRSSLKNVEAQLTNLISPIYRCHRGYLINIEYFKIGKITSRTMLVTLKGYGDEIPVSKPYAEKIKQLLPIHH